MPARPTQQRATRSADTRRVVGAGVRRPGSISGFSSSRARILAAMRELACEEGYHAVSATTLIKRARVSSKTFYENFADTEECFITTYDEAMAEIEGAMRPAYMRPGRWTERVRAALEALLVLLEEDRELATVVFLEAPKARRLLGGRRARVLEILQLVLDSGRSGDSGAATPPLIDELLVEGAISVIRARVASPQEGALSRLVDELMGVITYSYVGPPTEASVRAPLTPGRVVATSPEQPAAVLRMTYRSLRVLTAVAEKPGACNREVAEAAGIGDQGQISRLLRRLCGQGLVRNEGLPRNGAPKRWYLTERGQALRSRGARDLERHRRTSS